MFGYVKPYKPELRVRELDAYKGVYCGLCRELRHYGVFARLTLSYDFAFLALLDMALSPQEPAFCPRRCMAHPLHRQACCQSSPAVRHAAAAAMILFYYKLRDDMADRGFGKKLLAALAMPFAAHARRRALALSERAAGLDGAAAEMMARQAALEAERSPSADLAAEPTAKFLEHALSLLSTDEVQQRVLKRMGYLFGRYIYLADAADDLEDDRAKGNYNPFLFGDGEALSHAKASLFATTAELGAALELLELHRFRPILENIVCLGLRAEVERITAKGGAKPE